MRSNYQKNMKEQVIQLIESSMLITEDNKDKLLFSIDDLSQEKLEQLSTILLSAEEKEDYFVKKALENNPDLLYQVESEGKKHIQSIRDSKENESKQEDAKILENLDEELNSVFE